MQMGLSWSRSKLVKSYNHCSEEDLLLLKWNLFYHFWGFNSICIRKNTTICQHNVMNIGEYFYFWLPTLLERFMLSFQPLILLQDLMIILKEVASLHKLLLQWKMQCLCIVLDCNKQHQVIKEISSKMPQKDIFRNQVPIFFLFLWKNTMWTSGNNQWPFNIFYEGMDYG